MRKPDLDHLLEQAVARAIGVKMPARKPMRRTDRRAARAHGPLRHAA